MSERLTDKWAINSEGAFGPNGKKGDKGELILDYNLTKEGIRHSWYPSNVEKQLKGVDFDIGSKPLSFDLKTNWRVSDDSICVEYGLLGWLFDRMKTSTWIVHGYVDNNGRYVGIAYPRVEMVSLVQHLQSVVFENGELYGVMDRTFGEDKFIRFSIKGLMNACSWVITLKEFITTHKD